MRKLLISLAAAGSVGFGIGVYGEPAAKSAPAGGGGARAAQGAPAQGAPAQSGATKNAGASNANSTPQQTDRSAQAANAQKSAETAQRKEGESRRGARTIIVQPWSGYYGWGYWDSPGYAQYGVPYNGHYGNEGYSSNSNYENGNTTWGNGASPSVNDLPSSLNGPARAEAEAARTAMREAEVRHEKDFKAKDEFVEAAKEQREAQAAYDAAVGKVRGQLKRSDGYKDAVTEKREAQQRVDAAQAAYKIGPTTAPAGEYFPQPAVAAAQAKLNAATEVTQLEREKFEQDPEVRKARERLDAANARMGQLRKQFEAEMANDPQWQAAKQKLDAVMAGGK